MTLEETIKSEVEAQILNNLSYKVVTYGGGMKPDIQITFSGIEVFTIDLEDFREEV